MNDFWRVKPNEFERGVLSGMLLKCGKSDSGGSTSYETVELIGNLAKIETSVTMDRAWTSYYGYECEDWYLHQKITYSDNKSLEWKAQLYRIIDGRNTLKKGEFLTWYFGEPNENGMITNIKWVYVNSDGAVTNTQSLEWYIPTTDPQVITV